MGTLTATSLPRGLPLAVTLAVVLIAKVAHAKYDFDDAFYNQQLLDQVDDALRPWRAEKDGGAERRQRPRFRHQGGVVVARWYPARRGDPPQYQWGWEQPVNQSARMWWRSYPRYYQPYRGGYYCGYRGYYRYCYRRYNGYDDYRRDYYGRRRFRRGGLGGYATWSGMFDRIVVNDKKAAPASAHRPASRQPTASPDEDAEQVSDMAKLPAATDEMLQAADERPGHVPFQEQACCGRYDEAALQEQDSLREQCYLEAFNGSRPGDAGGWDYLSCTAVQDVKQKIKCVHLCLWKLRGALDAEGRALADSVRDFVRGSDNQQWRREVMEKAVAKCVSESDEDTAEYSDSRDSCQRGPLDLSYCIWEELQAACPDEEWNSKSRYCNRLRTHIRSRRRGSQ